MSFYDLNVPHPASGRMLSTLDKCYGTVAVNQIHHGKVTPNTTIKNLVKGLSFPDIPRIKILSRITLLLEDISINYQLANTTKEFDLVAVRPTTEKTLAHACTSMDIDIISLDLSVRLPYYLKHSTLGSATARGVYLEICYGAGIADTTARRQLLSNAANLVRATRGRGIIVSSEALDALHLRGPYDLINLATFWGLNQEMGKDTICENARRVVVKADTRRNVHKGVIRVTQQPEIKTNKRAVPDLSTDSNTMQNKKQKQKQKQKQIQVQKATATAVK